MNIIFGERVTHVPDSYTILELDTFRFIPDDTPVTSWCVVEQIALEEFSTLEHKKKIHSDLLLQYRAKNWNFCINAIGTLMGSWGGQVDSFYEEMSSRVAHLQQNPPDSHWNGYVLSKSK